LGGERVEELEPHLWVPGIEVGVAGRWVVGVDSNSGDGGGGAPAMVVAGVMVVVAGVMGLRLGEVPWDDGRSARRCFGEGEFEWLGLKASWE
jgi:hypothetical protein